MKYVFMYLVAIVLANLSVAYFGVAASYINAFVFIGLDLSSRDKLHDLWLGKGIVWKMGLLILLGSLISWLLNKDAGIIAIASFVAFGVSSLVDTIVYQILHNKKYLVRVNGSNIFSALADSVVFPTIAFGSFLPVVVLGQFLCKFVGGFVWSLILNIHRSKYD